MKLPLLTATILLGLAPSLCAQAPFVETTELGTTDWIKGYVEATAQGTARYMGNKVQEELMAKQAARTTAQARLLEIIKGIRLSGISTLGAQAQSDTRAATRIKGTLKGARSVNETVTWHEDKSSRRGEVVMAEVTLRLCVSPTCTETRDNLTHASLAPFVKPKPASHQSETLEGDYSAVIIDLQQAMFLPALSPEIINEKGDTIYSQDVVDDEVATQKGLIHYEKSVEMAKKNAVCGSNPFIVSAQRVSTDNRIVLSNEDAAKIRNLPALKLGRVIVAMD